MTRASARFSHLSTRREVAEARAPTANNMTPRAIRSIGVPGRMRAAHRDRFSLDAGKYLKRCVPGLSDPAP
jgi:hypothetical protein